MNTLLSFEKTKAVSLLALILFIVGLALFTTKIYSSQSQEDRLRQKCLHYAQTYPDRALPDICKSINTPSPSPSTSPTPTMSAQPTPSHTPSHSPEASPSNSPQQDFEYCQTHDPVTYHGLYNQAEDCWYNHEHGDNPSTVDDIFGPTSAWWGGSQTISYPWQTFAFDGSATGGGDNFPVRTGLYENEAKHNGYKWYVRRNLDCYSAFEAGCVKAVRTVDHALGSSHGAITRFHSFATEMVVCLESNPNDCGIVRTAGWQDKGGLFIDQELIPGFGPQNGAARLHYYQEGNSHFGTWYGGTSKATTVPQFEDMWGYVYPENPAQHSVFCEGDPTNCGYNNSRRQLHLVGAAITGREVNWLRSNGFVSDSNKINFKGFTDRYGTIIKDGTCTTVSLDCIPIEYQNYDASVRYQYRGDTREYDTSIGILENSPIRYPN